MSLKTNLKPSLLHKRRLTASANQEKGLNGSNFITLGKISKEEKIEIIQTGETYMFHNFNLRAEFL